LNKVLSKSRFVILGIMGLIIIVYIAATYAGLAFAPQRPRRVSTPDMERGAILDRNGKPLAVQVWFYHLALIPSALGDLKTAASVLAPVSGFTEEEVLQRINSAGIDFLYLKKKMTGDEYEAAYAAIQAARLNGVHFDKIPGRIYPENDLASQLVGFMGDDGAGLSGMEYAMQGTLAPKLSTDPASAVNGSNVFLTIDANLQYKLEQRVAEALKETGGDTVMLIAADAKTGEILSYISLPAANLNEYPFSTPEERIDLPAVTSYEPGSVFKIFSVASFLDAGVISDSDRFFCDGVYELRLPSGETIRINCQGNHGWVNPRDALKFSCNDALGQMSERIDGEKFIGKLREFGFGRKTGVELPSETPGMLRSPGDRTWSVRSKPTISIGQEVGVSALQVVQATLAIANSSSGSPVKLAFVSKIAAQDGTVSYEHRPLVLNSVIAPQTAGYLLSYMESGAESDAVGRFAALGDITIGVKTGTAQMADLEHGGYSETDFLADCVAVFPVEDPKIVLYIVLTRPRVGSIFASRNVAPVIADAANIIIDHLGLGRPSAPSFAHSGTVALPNEEDLLVFVMVPDFTGAPKRILTPLLERRDLRVIIHGDGWVARQEPPPGTPVTENMTIELFLE
jgi:cell division protein FtsI (penicillin-binding protein 3)